MPEVVHHHALQCENNCFMKTLRGSRRSFLHTWIVKQLIRQPDLHHALVVLDCQRIVVWDAVGETLVGAGVAGDNCVVDVVVVAVAVVARRSPSTPPTDAVCCEGY